MSDEIIEVAAKEAYEESLRIGGIRGGWCQWEFQSEKTKFPFRRFVEIVARRLELGMPLLQKSTSAPQATKQ